MENSSCVTLYLGKFNRQYALHVVQPPKPDVLMWVRNYNGLLDSLKSYVKGRSFEVKPYEDDKDTKPFSPRRIEVVRQRLLTFQNSSQYQTLEKP